MSFLPLLPVDPVPHPCPQRLDRNTRLLLLDFNLVNLFFTQIRDLVIRQERLLGREQQRSGRVHSQSDEEPEQPSDVEEVRRSADVDAWVDGVDETWEKRWYRYDHRQCCSPILGEAEVWYERVEIG